MEYAKALSECGDLPAYWAWKISSALSSRIDVKDLAQAGMLGLLDAANKYVDDGRAAFKTYATIRIRGAIIDEVRDSMLGPRDPMKRGDFTIEYDEAMVDAALDEADGPHECAVHLERWSALMHAIAELPPRDRAVIEAILWGGRLKHEIAADMGCSPSRVSQIMQRSVTFLSRAVVHPDRSMARLEKAVA